MRETEPQPVPHNMATRYVTQRISLTAIIQLLIIIGTIVAGWIGLNYRVSNLETSIQAEESRTAKMMDVVDRTNQTLDLLNQRLQDFPLHRHDKDGSINYPYGTSDKAFDGQGLKK